MRKWVHITLKFKYFILAFISFFILLAAKYSQQESRFSGKNFQALFLQQEKNLQQQAKNALETFEKKGNVLAQNGYTIHIYRNEDLIKWNTNQLPLSNIKKTDFPTNGLVKLSNGWYYAACAKKNDLLCCASFSILKEYSYSNEFIQPVANPLFGKNPFLISTDRNQGFPIYNLSHTYCFSIIGLTEHSFQNNAYILPLILIGLVSFLFGIYTIVEKQKQGRWMFLVGLLFLRIIAFEIPLTIFFPQAHFLDAKWFAYTEWFPSFYDFCINCVFISFGILTIFKSIQRNEHWLFRWIHFVLLFGVWWLMVTLIHLLILHSTIPLNFNQFFDLTSLSFVFFTIIGLLFLSFQTITFGLVSSFKTKLHQLLIAAISSTLIILVLWMKGSLQSFSFLPIILPLLIVLLQIIFQNRKSNFEKFLFQLLLLCSFTVTFVQVLIQKNEQKELENRVIYAKNLATERDINLELDFLELKEKLISDTLFFHQTTLGEFSSTLEKKYFHGPWDGYDLQFQLYDSTGNSCFADTDVSYEKIKNLLSGHSQVSDIDGSIFFMPHEENGISYVILQKINPSAELPHLQLCILLKSKRIPEEIGFPRLLISDKANVLNSIENYSIGKYSEGQLIHQSGSFNYPISIGTLLGKHMKEGSFTREGYYHYFYRKTPQNAIVISLPMKSWFDYMTSFAYIFCYWGILVLIIYFLNGRAPFSGLDFSFAFKIQISFVLVIVLSLLLYGIGSGIFVGKQYEGFTRKNIQEKLSSIQAELKAQLAHNSQLNAKKDRAYLQNTLQKISSVYKTDVNIYNLHGYLVASSRPKIFELGLIGEQMNPKAMYALIDQHKSSFSHSEEIGQLAYISAYLPIFNEEHQEIGYINLQHFGQQQEYETQIQTFVTSMLNVFMLLLALSVIFGLLVTNWLIAPLNMLRKHMSNIQFGKENKHIKYGQKDEIGAIVQAYNEKLDELQVTAQKLASTEREIAWREMAQQIAHEIKNPLTPMKLSIQHLLRSYDPTHVEGEKQLKRVLDSIIEQIDGLTRMANEFSQFAKMPEPILHVENMNEIVDKVRLLYENESSIQLDFQQSEKPVMVSIDRNLWIQVLVNLLQNAQQALTGIPKGKIELRVLQKNHHCYIEISDNGCGISLEESPRIFTPHFTTKSSGSGIGLSLVKQIVEKHGGNITFKSIQHEGTTFQIVLPLVQSE